ncbi:MAG: hypothetical protein WD512_15065, partial [Candidatus Paceibacterota bacterium]
SNKLRITKINKKTNAKMFKDLIVGNVILLSIPVKYAGGNKGTYASYIRVENLDSGESSHKSFNQIESVLDMFEFEIA